jgi:hypothetical protein
VRDALGATEAMNSNRSARCMLWSVIVLTNAWAAGPAPSGLSSCPPITDDKQRLACFDREFALQEQRKTRVPDAAKTSQATPAAGAQLTPEQRMGLAPAKILELQGSSGTRDLKELTAKIQSVSSRADGRHSFTLENGQVWDQTQPDPQFTARPGETVRISKGMLGSYFMSVNRHMNTRVLRAR